MSKFFTAAALALAVFCCPSLYAAAGPQTSKVRVGPGADDKPAPAPVTPKNEKKPGDARDAKTARPPEQRPEQKPEPKSAPADGPAKKETQQTPSVASSNATAPPGSNDTSTTSDAPPKANAAAPPPVAPAEKNGKPEAGGDGVTSKAPSSSTKTDPPAPANTANTTPANTAAPNNTPASNATRPAASAPASSPAAAPSSSAPPTSVYRIGVGDVLDVRLLNLPEGRQSTLFTVLAGGVLEYPLLRDPVTAVGMTTDELAAQLVAELRHRGVYDRPQVRVGVREYASHAVLVSGLVSEAGTKILRREAIPLYVVVAEARPKPEAGRAVVFSHATGKTTNVDLNDAQAMGLLVQQGDVINLVARPPEFFYIGGEISQPGQKEFHTGMTLTQAVLASGGMTRLSSGRVRVSRQGAGGRLVFTEYVLQEIENGVVPDPSIRAGDRIEIWQRKK